MTYDAVRQAFENAEPMFLSDRRLRAVFRTLEPGEPLRREFQQLEAESFTMNRGDAEQMAHWTERAHSAMRAARRRIA